MREPMMVASRLFRYSTSEETPLMYLLSSRARHQLQLTPGWAQQGGALQACLHALRWQAGVAG